MWFNHSLIGFTSRNRDKMQKKKLLMQADIKIDTTKRLKQTKN